MVYESADTAKVTSLFECWPSAQKETRFSISLVLRAKNNIWNWLNFMSTACFIFGLCQAVTGFTEWMLLRREEEKVKDSP